MEEQVLNVLPPFSFLEIVETLLHLRHLAALMIQKAFKRHRLKRALRVLSLASRLRQIRVKAASYIAKELRALLRRPPKPQLKLVFAEKQIAHPTSTHFTAVGTEDACFIDDGCQTFGLADGVGSWKDHGVSAAMFSQELMQRTKALMAKERLGYSDVAKKTMMANVLKVAHSQMKSFGSSTVLLGAVKHGILTTLTLGDTSLIVLREVGGSLTRVYKTLERQHSFNCPFQLANIPKKHELAGLAPELKPFVDFIKNSKPISDPPSEAALSNFKLQNGDIVIAATDGLFDNLQRETIIKLAENELDSPALPKLLAVNIANKLARDAASLSLNLTYLSPFARSARRARLKYNGGKPDDITVVVGVAVIE